MTNNDELALKLKAAAEKASGGEWLREAGEGWHAICSDDDQVNGGFIICSFQGNDAESNRKFVQRASPANILALLAERDADKKQLAAMSQAFLNLKLLADVYLHAYEEAKASVAELEAAASSKFMPVGVMSQSKFESLDNGDVRFIALWPRPCVPVRRKRPDDGVLVYAKVAGIKLDVGE